MAKACSRQSLNESLTFDRIHTVQVTDKTSNIVEKNRSSHGRQQSYVKLYSDSVKYKYNKVKNSHGARILKRYKAVSILDKQSINSEKVIIAFYFSSRGS